MSITTNRLLAITVIKSIVCITSVCLQWLLLVTACVQVRYALPIGTVSTATTSLTRQADILQYTNVLLGVVTILTDPTDDACTSPWVCDFSGAATCAVAYCYFRIPICAWVQHAMETCRALGCMMSPVVVLAEDKAGLAEEGAKG